jgi:hypothetical protein
MANMVKVEEMVFADGRKTAESTGGDNRFPYSVHGPNQCTPLSQLLLRTINNYNKITTKPIVLKRETVII